MTNEPLSPARLKEIDWELKHTINPDFVPRSLAVELRGEVARLTAELTRVRVQAQRVRGLEKALSDECANSLRLAARVAELEKVLHSCQAIAVMAQSSRHVDEETRLSCLNEIEVRAREALAGGDGDD